jgi:hypothetical protein
LEWIQLKPARLGEVRIRRSFAFTTRVRIRIETIMLGLSRYLRTLPGEVLGVENEKFGEQFDLMVLDIIGQSMLGQRFSLTDNFVRL